MIERVDSDSPDLQLKEYYVEREEELLRRISELEEENQQNETSVFADARFLRPQVR